MKVLSLSMNAQSKFIYIYYILHTLYKTIHTHDGCHAVKQNDNKYYMYYSYTFNNTQHSLTTLSNVFIQVEPLAGVYHNFNKCSSDITHDMFTIVCFVAKMGSYNTYGNLYIMHDQTRIQTYNNIYIFSCYPDHDIKHANFDNNIAYIGSRNATMLWKTNYWDNEYYIRLTNFYVNEEMVKQSENYRQCYLSTGCTYTFIDLNPCTNYNLTIENVFDNIRNSIAVKTIKTICTTKKSKERKKYTYRYISIAVGLVILLVILVLLYRYNKKRGRISEAAKGFETYEEARILDDRELYFVQQSAVPVYQDISCDYDRIYPKVNSA